MSSPVDRCPPLHGSALLQNVLQQVPQQGRLFFGLRALDPTLDLLLVLFDVWITGVLIDDHASFVGLCQQPLGSWVARVSALLQGQEPGALGLVLVKSGR